MKIFLKGFYTINWKLILRIRLKIYIKQCGIIVEMFVVYKLTNVNKKKGSVSKYIGVCIYILGAVKWTGSN